MFSFLAPKILPRRILIKLCCSWNLARLPVLSLVTVRHPADPWLSIKQRGWAQFEPETLDEYCRRYQKFLDDHRDIALVKYEDFVADPERVCRTMLKTLELQANADWQSMLPAIRMTGDSGRSSNVIASRERRKVPRAMREAFDASQPYRKLSERLHDPPEL